MPSRQVARNAVTRGVTLIEVCIVGAMAAILAGSALTFSKDSNQKRRADSSAVEVAGEVNFARAAAVAQGRGVWLSYAMVGGRTCALVHAGGKNDCHCGADAQPVCTAEGQALKTVLHAAPVQMAAPIRFDPVNGTVTPTATIRIAYAQGQELHHKVNVMGRVRTCSPGGAVKGYPAC